MTTIPASELVAVNPSVLSVGGDALDLNGLILTTNPQIPLGAVVSFPDGDAVDAYFGATSAESALAATYFEGFDGSTAKPGALLLAQYNTSDVYAYLRGANISALPLATLQSYNATLTVTVDGVIKTGSVDLSAATSFANAAKIAAEALEIDGIAASGITASIGATFTGTGSGTNLTASAVTGKISIGDAISGTGVPGSTVIVSQTSGTAGGAGVYVTNNVTTSSGASLTATSSVLNVTVVGSGAPGALQVLSGAGVTDDTYITAQLTGTAGGVGTYRLDTAQQVASEAMTTALPGIVYDSIAGAFVVRSGTTGATSTITYGSGAMATDLLLTQANGAVLSQGAVAATPSAFMNALVAINSDWATFMTAFNPDNSGNANKQLFAAWKNTKNNRFAYVCWDLDASPTTTLPALTSLGYILANNGDSGTCLLDGDPAAGWNLTTATQLAAFVMGAGASIDFTETNGRVDFAFKGQAGITGTVIGSTIANNLGGSPSSSARGNGYNFYGAYGTANVDFVWFQRGFVTGRFLWLDSYLNQIWLNAKFQLELLTFLQNSKSVPYSTAGNSRIEAALSDDIQQGLRFGAYGAGPISAGQAAAVNADAGANVSPTLQTQGYYLQIGQASSSVRAARTSPPAKFWYLDRGSVQQITLSSIAVQ